MVFIEGFLLANFEAFSRVRLQVISVDVFRHIRNVMLLRRTVVVMWAVGWSKMCGVESRFREGVA